MKRPNFHYILLLLLAGCHPVFNDSANPNITQSELRGHVRYLASPELNGRRTGEEGNRLAAAYIAKEFSRYGLKPAGDSGTYFQHFQIIASVKPAADNALMIRANGLAKNFTLDEQFRPIAFTENTSVTGPLVFVGYGITTKDDSVQYDDYAGLDVKGKIVAAMRYSPAGPGDNRFTRYHSLMEKAYIARDHGAVGILFLSAAPGQEGADLIPFKYPVTKSAGIASAAVRWMDMDTLLQAAGKDLKEIQQRINTSQKPESFEIPNVEATLKTQTERVYAKSANIAGLLEGNDLKGQLVVVGAHMDHLGMGGENSLQPDTVAIHPGADDNASGTAGLLEVAQYLSSQRASLKRTVLFLAFSGEEEGLLGSDYYVKNPTLPLDSTIAMLNMDMIGRMKDSTLIVEGMGTSPNWETIVRRENGDSSLHLKLKPDGYGPSDHASFYGKNIPVLFFFTGLHQDYHRPADTWEKLNYAGEESVAGYVARLTVDVANEPARPSFTKTATPAMASGGDRQGIRVSLGVIPDYAEDVVGLKITGVRPGSPADKAGLLGADVIVKFGGDDVKNIYDYTHLLGKYKPGDVVTVVVKRGTTDVTLKATLEGRK